MANDQGGGADKLMYFLVGAGIGAVTALLFAPKAGSELRSEIADATRKGIDKARDTSREFGDRASDIYHTGVEKAADLQKHSRETVGDLAERGKDLVHSKKAQVAAAFEAGKQGYREAKHADLSGKKIGADHDEA